MPIKYFNTALKKILPIVDMTESKVKFDKNFCFVFLTRFSKLLTNYLCTNAPVQLTLTLKTCITYLPVQTKRADSIDGY